MDRKRELFKRYLEEKKIMDLLSKIVVSMYECSDKPQDPLKFIEDYLSSNENLNISSLRLENLQLSKQLLDLQNKLEEIQKKLNFLKKK